MPPINSVPVGLRQLRRGVAAPGKSRPDCSANCSRAMAERLDALPGLRASFELDAGENHMSILPVTVNRAVQAAFAVR